MPALHYLDACRSTRSTNRKALARLARALRIADSTNDATRASLAGSKVVLEARLALGSRVGVYSPRDGASALGYVSQVFANGRVRVRAYGALGSSTSWIVTAYETDVASPDDEVRRVSKWYASTARHVAIV